MKAYITGASHGIGRGIAKVLAEAGYDIAYTYNSRLEEAESLKAEIEALGRRAFVFQADLMAGGVAEPTAKDAVKALGGVDLCVCNAGRTFHNSILHVSEDMIDAVYNLDYRSYLITASVCANSMVDRGVRGNIIFITSTRGIRSYPNDLLYGGMKAALSRTAESMALDLSRYKIRVNCIAPGNTATGGNFTAEELSRSRFQQAIPLGRSGKPADIGYLVKFLASEEASYITGMTIKVDGGLILPGMPEDGTRW